MEVGAACVFEAAKGGAFEDSGAAEAGGCAREFVLAEPLSTETFDAETPRGPGSRSSEPPAFEAEGTTEAPVLRTWV